jgi:hypothetical protein
MTSEEQRYYTDVIIPVYEKVKKVFPDTPVVKFVVNGTDRSYHQYRHGYKTHTIVFGTKMLNRRCFTTGYLEYDCVVKSIKKYDIVGKKGYRAIELMTLHEIAHVFQTQLFQPEIRLVKKRHSWHGSDFVICFKTLLNRLPDLTNPEFVV